MSHIEEDPPEITIDARRFAGVWANAVRVNGSQDENSGTTIGRELSPEYQRIIDRARGEQLRRLEERRKAGR
jgi:hypothetical protein